MKRQEIDPRSRLRWAPGCGPVEPPMPTVIGVDVGQMSDFTAICVAEAEADPRYKDRFIFHVRHLERLPLGTKYRAVGKRIEQVVLGVQARDLKAVAALHVSIDEPLPRRDLSVIVDTTGVGRGVFDIIVDDLVGLGVRVVAATFNFGAKVTATGRGKSLELHVGKAALVSRVQALLQSQRIILPASLAEAAALVAELENYEIRVDERGTDTYGSFRTGQHDDLATALGLAVLLDPVPVSRGATLTAITF